MTCPVCGYENGPRDRACKSCGYALGAGNDPAVRQQLSPEFQEPPASGYGAPPAASGYTQTGAAIPDTAWTSGGRYEPPQKKGDPARDTQATVGFMAGILSLSFLCITPVAYTASAFGLFAAAVAVILSLCAIVLSVHGLSSCRRRIAVAGLVLSIIGFLLNLLLLLGLWLVGTVPQ